LSILNQTLTELLNLNNDVLNEHLMNKKSLSLSYQTFFTSIFQKDLCTLPVLLTLENCTTLLDGTAVNVNKISYKY